MAQELPVYGDKSWSWGDFARLPWNLIAVPLALIILMDVTARRIEWTAPIQWLAVEYARWMALALSWSPIAIPLESKDYIVLLCIFFSITNLSYRRRTGRLFATDLLSFGLSRSLHDPQQSKYLGRAWQETLDNFAAVVTSFAIIPVLASVPACCFLLFVSFFIPFNTETVVTYGKWPLIMAVVFGSGFLIAWRWLLSIGLLFGLLAVFNGVYLHGLATFEFLPLSHLPFVR